MPVYSRKDWRQSADSVDWAGILGAYGILDHLLHKFAGKPMSAPAPASSAELPVLQDGQDAEQRDEDVEDDREGDCEDNVVTDVAAQEEDFRERRRRNRADMTSWCRTDPYPRLVLLREILGALFRFVFLLFGGRVKADSQ